jgi:SNF2 family DNA or RNA helicase
MSCEKLQLYPYQEQGVNWMLEREHCTIRPSGLLLDECGIGKTPQMISTMYRNPQPLTLVILPVNLIKQWEAQLQKWVPDMNILIFHGAAANQKRQTPKGQTTKESALEFFQSFQQGDKQEKPLVVLTSYGKVVDRKFEKRKKQLKLQGEKIYHKVGSTILHELVWDRIILDEAHLIRNHSTVRTRYIFELRGRIKWCLTATPIHNGIDDYQALLRFMGFNKMEIAQIFAHHPILEKYLNDRARNFLVGNILDLDGLKVTKANLPPLTHETITLRRTKRGVSEISDTSPPTPQEEGASREDDTSSPSVNKRQRMTLPPLQVEILEVCADQAELQFYRNLRRATQLELLDFNHDDEGGANRVVEEQVLFELLLRLRQASVNPRLAIAGFKRKFGGRFPVSLLHGIVDPIGNVGNHHGGPIGNVGNHHGGPRGNGPLVDVQPHPITTRAQLAAAEAEFWEKLGEPCKTRHLKALLRAHPREKAIVFCEFTEEMALLQRDLSLSGIQSVCYDGSMSIVERDEVVRQFHWSVATVSALLEEGAFFPGVRHVPLEIVERICSYFCFDVVLVQINSGNAGLNLQMCSRIYFTNPTWNPCTEIQAISRAHRCGQEKPVYAVKLCSVLDHHSISGHIDQRVLEVQEAKRKVMADILGDSELLDNGQYSQGGIQGGIGHDANAAVNHLNQLTRQEIDYLLQE